MKDRTSKDQVLLTGTRRQKAIVEFRDPGWRVMHTDGQIEEWDTASAALKAIQKRAMRRNPGVTVTVIEWRDVPLGFVPPKGAQ